MSRRSTRTSRPMEVACAAGCLLLYLRSGGTADDDVVPLFLSGPRLCISRRGFLSMAFSHISFTRGRSAGGVSFLPMRARLMWLDVSPSSVTSSASDPNNPVGSVRRYRRSGAEPAQACGASGVFGIRTDMRLRQFVAGPGEPVEPVSAAFGCHFRISTHPLS